MSGKDTVDTMFEDFFGHTATPKPPEARKKARKPKAPPLSPEDAEKAARAVQDALRADDGRSKKVDTWRPVAAKALGVTKLYQKKWDAVIARGQDLGLFQMESSLSYPRLVVAELEPESEPESEYLKPRRRPKKRKNPPTMMDCGHWNLWRRPDGCQACKLKIPPDYAFMSEKFGKPVPEIRRRKPDDPQGLCCDNEGNYIGGVTNDCRRDSPDDRRCICHGGLKGSTSA